MRDHSPGSDSTRCSGGRRSSSDFVEVVEVHFLASDVAVGSAKKVDLLFLLAKRLIKTWLY